MLGNNIRKAQEIVDKLKKEKAILFPLARKNKMQFIAKTDNVVELTLHPDANQNADYCFNYLNTLMIAQSQVDYPLGM